MRSDTATATGDSGQKQTDIVMLTACFWTAEKVQKSPSGPLSFQGGTASNDGLLLHAPLLEFLRDTLVRILSHPLSFPVQLLGAVASVLCEFHLLVLGSCGTPTSANTVETHQTLHCALDKPLLAEGTRDDLRLPTYFCGPVRQHNGAVAVLALCMIAPGATCRLSVVKTVSPYFPRLFQCYATLAVPSYPDHAAAHIAALAPGRYPAWAPPLFGRARLDILAPAVAGPTAGVCMSCSMRL